MNSLQQLGLPHQVSLNFSVVHCLIWGPVRYLFESLGVLRESAWPLSLSFLHLRITTPVLCTVWLWSFKPLGFGGKGEWRAGTDQHLSKAFLSMRNIFNRVQAWVTQQQALCCDNSNSDRYDHGRFMNSDWYLSVTIPEQRLGPEDECKATNRVQRGRQDGGDPGHPHRPHHQEVSQTSSRTFLILVSRKYERGRFLGKGGFAKCYELQAVKMKPKDNANADR